MSLDPLRRATSRFLLGLLWLVGIICLGLDALTAPPDGVPWLATLLGLGLAAGLSPAALRRPAAPSPRYLMTVGLMAAVSILVWRGGSVWQLDMHMAYFAGLAVAAGYCDPRAIMLGTVVVALHHLGLDLLLPGTVFPTGTGSFARVVLHAVILVIEALALAWLGHALDGAARTASEAMAASERARLAEAEAEARAEAIKRETEAQSREGRQHFALEIESEMGFANSSLAGTMADLAAVAKQLDESAKNAQAEARASRDGIGRSLEDVNQVVAAAELLASTVDEVAHHVSRASEVSQRSVGAAEDANRTVSGLATAVGEIGSIVKVIRNIAGQTNLLALNATIEAARAGEAGKGFAVVASEVKSLANSTASATEEIAKQIAAIQERTGSAVEAIATIAMVIGDIKNEATNIANVVTEQEAATRAIAEAIVRVSTGTEGAAGAAERSAVAIGEAADLMVTLEAAGGEIAQQQELLERSLARTVEALRRG